MQPTPRHPNPLVQGRIDQELVRLRAEAPTWVTTLLIPYIENLVAKRMQETGPRPANIAPRPPKPTPQSREKADEQAILDWLGADPNKRIKR